MKPILVMLVGVAGSGKSTYAKRYCQDYEIFSSDELRKELYGDVNNQNHNDKLFQILYKRISKALSEKKNCLFDATNLNTKRRTSFLNYIKHIDCFKECVILATPIELCIKQNLSRERQVPEYVIWNQVKQFNMPHYGEGWDMIMISQDYYNEDLPSLEQYFEYETAHDCNPKYHLESIQEHMRMAKKNAKNAQEDKNIVEALAYHDIGKLFTKEFGEDGFAHYYQHENVSAYLYLTSYEFRNLETAVLIQYHMLSYQKGVLRKRGFSERLISKLEIINEYDRISRY